MAGSPTKIESLDVLTDRYEALLCDVWGVVHNGVEAFPDACRALTRARARGVVVVLITNSPRPREGVEAQLAALGVPDDCWDRVVTSGDVTRDLIREAPRKLFHVGSDRDLPIYDGLDCELVEEFEADAVVCTGLMDDETETPEDYADMLRRFRSRNLPFICANPDIVVERGDRLIWCAGALARDYGQLGGRTLISGKPHRPIYEAALRVVGELLGREADRSKTLAIGDGMLTDIKGATDNDIDALYVSGGIHARDYGEAHDSDPKLLAAFLEKHGQQPVAVIPRLR
ncbi:TIGR01459 family HAD-type hydrolase [Pseudaminobacter sp. NGMCC 1.201702]|uniref:TIGR01459 family HAD-type hydrolase n=1 Tax=Pseudaminobacter sp. NGMCC 1.201702 TaxID=3391825 RepID=UPI0039F0AE59